MGFDYEHFQEYCENHAEDPVPPAGVAEVESKVTAAAAKRWADAMWGQGHVGIVKKGGAWVYQIGFRAGADPEVVGEGRSWDDAVSASGGDPEEVQELRERGQG